MSESLLAARGGVLDARADGASSRPSYQSFHRRGLESRFLTANDLANWPESEEATESVPETVARENVVCPLTISGDRVILAAAEPENLSLADNLRFLLNRDIGLVGAPRSAIVAAINARYGKFEGESADSVLCEFTDSCIDFSEIKRPEGRLGHRGNSEPWELASVQSFSDRPFSGTGISHARRLKRGLSDGGAFAGNQGMFFQTIEDGQRVLMKRRNGTMEVLVGPRRVWRGWRTFMPMPHYVAHPGEYLAIRYRDGRQEHLFGPTELWFDPRTHEDVSIREALQIAAQEAVVVYSQPPAGDESKPAASRRIVYGPALFASEPGEWLHTFSWHASKGSSRGTEKVPNALVFQKLWLMPDQMYHDVHDVRTADDAVLTVRLMIFFELVDIDRMLDATHDPIGDFVNAATADVVEFTGRHDFEAFKRNTASLNDMATYRQLSGRANQCGYKINNVVYRGYGAAESLQQMHNQAIEARTKLQLDRATEQQAQELEDYRLASQMARASRRRGEQTEEVRHEMQLAREKHEAQMALRDRQQSFQRQQRLLDSRQRDEIARLSASQHEEHLRTLKEMGVDLTAYLTQARADSIIELRGSVPANVHVDRIEGRRNGRAGQPT